MSVGTERLRGDIIDAASHAVAVDWEAVTGHEKGLCIPISVYVAAFLKARGVSDTRVVEAGVVVVDPASPRRGYIGEGASDEEILDGVDAPGLLPFGHTCVWLPTHRLVIDASLPTQRMKILSGLGVNDVLVVGTLDHTKGHIAFKTQIGRGQLIYRLYPKRTGWAKRHWPYEFIREMATKQARERTVYAGDIATA